MPLIIPRVRQNRLVFARVVLALAALGCAAVACGPSLEEQTREHATALVSPAEQDFPQVGDALELSCGTLDCHGQAGRNLRLYGFGGLRLSASDTTDGDPTTDLEYLASYDSLVSLEPETLSRVVAQQADPNQLTLVRKTRGIEHHKGGQRALIGDALDRCIVLWLIGDFAPEPCSAVVDALQPNTE
jgi:hypothetical protein